MLTHLYIRDFAIIDSVELEFGAGMTVFTGETGAGKSILFDALGLVLGDRADSTQVRSGADRADVCASFSVVANPTATTWLSDNELTTGGEGECVIRRTLASDGRSRGYINGQIVTLQSLRALLAWRSRKNRRDSAYAGWHCHYRAESLARARNAGGCVNQSILS